MTNDAYIAAAGLSAAASRMNDVTHNLANSRTPGFRARHGFQEAIQAVQGGSRSSLVSRTAGTFIEPGGGRLERTGRSLDLAILDEGLLRVGTDQGLRYSRAGALELTAEGTLIHGSGNPVLDANGESLTGLPAGISIKGDGTIFSPQGDLLGQLAIDQAAPEDLQPTGFGLLINRPDTPKPQPVDNPRVRSGWIETSSTDPFNEMVRLIETQRTFERLQKALSQSMNEVNRSTVTDIAGN